MPRILILHASVGTGHRSAALALADAFARKQAEVRVEDALEHANPLFRQAYAGTYLDVTNRAPLLWQFFYQNTDVADPDLIELTNRLRTAVERLGVTDLRRLLAQYRPAAVICTHFLPVDLLLRLKHKGRLPQPIYSVVTDFFAHTFWIEPGIDGYFVATEMTRDQMVARGVPAPIISVSGIPIKLEVDEPKQALEARARHALPLDGPLVTLFGGGLQTERVRAIVQELLASPLDGTLAVVAGRNEALSAALADLRDGPTLRLRRYDQIDFVDDLVVASDLVVTKAGGLIVSEVLARGTPMLLIDPIPGQEEWNADYVVGVGAGTQVRIAATVPRAVAHLLAHPERLANLRFWASRAGRPRAAMDIAEAVLEDLRIGKHA